MLISQEIDVPESRAEHLRQVTALAHQLVDIVSQQKTHLIALEALISAYASVAVSHPCCALHAAATAHRVAGLIENSIASAPSQAGAAHFH